jgi:hypothetical protein
VSSNDLHLIARAFGASNADPRIAHANTALERLLMRAVDQCESMQQCTQSSERNICLPVHLECDLVQDRATQLKHALYCVRMTGSSHLIPADKQFGRVGRHLSIIRADTQFVRACRHLIIKRDLRGSRDGKATRADPIHAKVIKLI